MRNLAKVFSPGRVGAIVLLTVGCFIFLCLIPAVEAAEQTILGLIVTLIAMRSKSYKLLSTNYQQRAAEEVGMMAPAFIPLDSLNK